MTEREISLHLRFDAEAVDGWFHAPDQPARHFSSWLGLLSLLEDLRDTDAHPEGLSPG